MSNFEIGIGNFRALEKLTVYKIIVYEGKGTRESIGHLTAYYFDNEGKFLWRDDNTDSPKES